MITASLKILGKTYASEGATVEEAIGNLKPERTKGVISVLSVEDGEKKRDKILSKFQTMNLFSPMALRRKHALTAVSMIFK